MGPATFRIRPRQRPRVRERPDRCPGVELIRLDVLALGDIRELLLVSRGEEDLVEAERPGVDVRQRLTAKRGPVESDNQRKRRLLAVDPEHLSSAQSERVPAQQIGELFDPWIAHWAI